MLLSKRQCRPLQALAAVLAMCAGLPTHAVAQDARAASSVVASVKEARIGAVNPDRILSESAPAKAAQQRLEQEFSKRGRDLQDMDSKRKALAAQLDVLASNSATPPADVVKKQRELQQLEIDFQRKQRSFQEDLNQRRSEEYAAILDRANRAIRDIAKRNGYDLIVQEGVYMSPQIDITDQVLKALAAPSSN